MADASRNLFAACATYTPPDIAASIEAAQAAFTTLIAPYVQSPEIDVRVAWCRAGTSRQQLVSYAKVDWRKVTAAAPLAWLTIKAWNEANLQTTVSPEVAAVTVHFAPAPERASVVEYSLHQTLLGASINRTLQDHVVSWTTTTFEAINGVVGYITLDHVAADVFGSMSPFERTVGLSYPWASRVFHNKARGYYWGNLLSSVHVDQIGGAARLAALPLAMVQPLANGYYLQLTDDINQIDRAKLAQLKEAMQPLLPEGYPQSPQYYAGLPDFVL